MTESLSRDEAPNEEHSRVAGASYSLRRFPNGGDIHTVRHDGIDTKVAVVFGKRAGRMTYSEDAVEAPRRMGVHDREGSGAEAHRPRLGEHVRGANNCRFGASTRYQAARQ